MNKDAHSLIEEFALRYKGTDTKRNTHVSLLNGLLQTKILLSYLKDILI